MDLQSIQTLVSTLGFPIVCTIGLAAFVYLTWKGQREDYNNQIKTMSERCLAREERLYSQMDKYNDALSAATNTLSKIDARISVLEDIVCNNQSKDK